MSLTHFNGVDAVTFKKGGVEITATAAELNALDGITSAVAELNLLDGVTATTAELNKVDGASDLVFSISKTIAFGDMTDNGDATGYIDFTASSLPADSLVLGWKCVTATGFTGDTTATVQVGVSGTVDLYSAVTSGSVAAAGTVGSAVKTTGVVFNEAAATPRVTITGGSDFGAISAGAATVTLYYIPLS